METDLEKHNVPVAEVLEQTEIYSFTAPPPLIRRVQNRANQMHDGNRSAMIVELLERGLEAVPLERPSP